MNTSKSKALFEIAQKSMPGGVNSPVRAFKGVGGIPRFIKKAAGAKVFDADGNEYTDYVASWGPMIAGHAHPQVTDAVKLAVEHGTSYGAPTELEVTLADMVVEAVPSIDMVRFVSSGTEAVMSALRLVRAVTKREKIIKFEGCYHGHVDTLLVQAGSGVTTLGLPDSPGVPSAVVADTLVAEYNNLDSVKQIIDAYPGEIAAVIVEPVAGNMGVVLPQPGFLAGLRQLTAENNSLLIFDEIISGFRVAYGGAQSLYDINPDMTTLGKIIGGGFPVGAYGGSEEIMSHIAPLGSVYQAGTLSGNPVAMTAGIETLKLLQNPDSYTHLEKLGSMLSEGLGAAAQKNGIPVYQTRVGSLMGLFFTDQDVVNFSSAKTSNTGLYGCYFHSMLEAGSYFAPSQFEAAFVSLAHQEADIAATLAAAQEVMSQLN